MILVDTSVWIEAFRSGGGAEAHDLRVLLDRDAVSLAAPIRVEILAGASALDQERLRRLLAALPNWMPESSTWALVEGWLPVASKAGFRFGMGDLLIAAIAAENEAPIWTLDADFERMAGLGWIQVHYAGAG